METGIYFGLPDDEYRDDPALSRGGLMDLMESPLTYWIKSRHNPHRPPEEPSKEMEFGSAVHVRVLQGRDEFDRLYYPMPDKRDFPMALKSGDQLRKHCKFLKLSAGGTLKEMSERIREVDKEVQLWTEIEDACAEGANGRIQLTRVAYENVETAAMAVEASPEIEKYIRNGWPEVSIFWTEEVETSSRKMMTVPMKARLDYLTFLNEGSKTVWGVPDLKTFATKVPRPVDQSALSAAIGYGLQAVTYTMGLRAIANHLEAHNALVMPAGIAFPVPDEIRFVFLMVRTGSVPDMAGFEYAEWVDGERQSYWIKSQKLYEKLLRQYADAVSYFGFDRRWVTPAGCVPIHDEMVPLWAL